MLRCGADVKAQKIQPRLWCRRGERALRTEWPQWVPTRDGNCSYALKFPSWDLRSDIELAQRVENRFLTSLLSRGLLHFKVIVGALMRPKEASMLSAQN